MSYCTTLPEKYKSWTKFYFDHAKQYEGTNHTFFFITEWIATPLRDFPAPVKVNKLQYSVRYIKDRMYEELLAYYNDTQFTMDELQLLRSSLFQYTPQTGDLIQKLSRLIKRKYQGDPV